jgi:KUP system potassium uptake protein
VSHTNQSENSSTFSLSLAALGIVYGDIGTSPLYAIRESLDGLPIHMVNILGILSLIFWSLISVISLKYLIILFRADNDGEGGILALLSLLKRYLKQKNGLVFILSIFGAGLMLSDGMLTPAISVVSAIEGLNVMIPSLSDWILPLTVIILVALFSVQSFGTAKIGFIFGPVIFIWFVTIGILGLLQIFNNPIVLKAVNPIYAIDFFLKNGWKGYYLLGGVFLVVTGGEALYADLGHFKKNPIRISWYVVALPCLLFNYFGQGAYLIDHPDAIVNPFYHISPAWFSFPLLIIATLATIIASQAVISATFSLTMQAVLLGLYPRLLIVQTSTDAKGQIYVPQMNLILALGTIFLIFTFKDSSAMAHAYGVAVNVVMLLTTLLIAYLSVKKWGFSLFKMILLFSLFVFIDVGFLGANIQKIHTGGWVPLTFATVCSFIMYTWHSGMNYLRKRYYMKENEFKKKLQKLHTKKLNRLLNQTVIFITDIYDQSGGNVLHFLEQNRILPDHILIVNYAIQNIPHVKLDDRFEVSCLSKNFCRLTLKYGFMDYISVPLALYHANDRKLLPFSINVDTANYWMEVPYIVASHQKRTLWFFWQEKFFSFLSRNYSASIEFYKLPFDRTMAIGAYYIV